MNTSANPYSPPSASATTAYGTDDRAGVTDMTVEMLRQTRPWVLFLSVMSFIGSAFMLLGGVAMIFVGMLMPRSSAGGPMMNVGVLGVVYIPMALLYVYPAIKLWSFGSSIAKLVANRTTADLEQALAHQKSFWKFIGIAMMILIGLYLLLIVGMMIAGMAAATRMH